MALPHIILFDNVNCTGAHTHLCGGLSLLSGDWNDRVTSFVILEGNWEFFVDVNFQGQMGGAGKILGPGVYNWIEAALGPGTNDRLTSLRPR
jgi:hypothetical protein